MSTTSQPRQPRQPRWTGRNGRIPAPLRPGLPFGRKGFFQLLAVVGFAGLLGLGIAAEYARRHAAPILRERMIQTLSATFHSPVELDALDISLVRGVEVQGRGLRIPLGTGAQGASGGKELKPLLSVETFRFHAGFKGLLRPTAHLETLRVDGAEVHIPPRAQRPALTGTRPEGLPVAAVRPAARPRTLITVGDIEATHARVFLETEKPGKEPLEFDIGRIHLEGGGATTAWNYTAELVNPKPVGDIGATGHIGPFILDNPRQTPVDGDYSFQHADLSTIKGIGGHLSSMGHFGGVLELISVEGDTDTPDFWIDTGNHPVPLHTHLRAHVDGTDGDTYLDRVDARLLQSTFTTQGKVVRIEGQGHDIVLDVSMQRGRIEDMLLMAVKTRPPLMDGALRMQARLHVPPGPVRVMQKVDLRGTFAIRNVRFSNAQFQDKVDGLSVRAQGKPEEVAVASRNHRAEVGSQMSARFTLIHGLVTAEDVHYEIPGATALLHGVYSTDGNVFEFKGRVRTEARASQMVNGWKSWLLKPVDPFLARHGAGVELPVQISGTQGDMHLGLALKDADEPSARMVNDLREKRAELREQAMVKRTGKLAHAPRRTAAESVQMERAQRRQMFTAERSAKPGAESGTAQPQR